jgi:uncharacterized Fe-S center protein
VYWASPIEVAALKSDAKIMSTNNLVKTRLILDKLLDNIQVGDKVAVKVHVGEAQNTRYLRPDYVREVVNAIKSKGGVPTLVETQGLGFHARKIDISEDYYVCINHRANKSDHEKIANLHGYNESIIGAPLQFIDGEDGTDGKRIQIDGIHLKDVSVASELFDFDKMVVISHFKGHPQATFGGALKQLGIGCVTKRNKFLAHMGKSIKINRRNCDISTCNQECIESCSVKAISIENDSAVINEDLCFGCLNCMLKCPHSRKDNKKSPIKRPMMMMGNGFVERVIDNALAVMTSFGPENIRYINFAFDIVVMCDCVSNPGPPVVPDLGIFGSIDPVAIDKACVDAETNAPGLPILEKDGTWREPEPPGVEKFKAYSPLSEMLGYQMQFEASLKDQIGSTDYELIKI